TSGYVLKNFDLRLALRVIASIEECSKGDEDDNQTVPHDAKEEKRLPVFGPPLCAPSAEPPDKIERKQARQPKGGINRRKLEVLESIDDNLVGAFASVEPLPNAEKTGDLASSNCEGR